MEAEWIIVVDPWQSYVSPALSAGFKYSSLSGILQRGQGRRLFGTGLQNCLAKKKLMVFVSIIEDIKKMRKSKSVLVAYHYFDCQDAAKRDVRGLLTSILSQLCGDSDDCRDVFSRLYAEFGDGLEHPSDVVLARYLDNILGLPGQVPVFIIIDALDECPNNIGTPSAREKVRNFVEDLVLSKRSNLSICITSRPEQDIQSVLNPLTSALRRVPLQEEGGQKEDINNYVRFFVQNDRAINAKMESRGQRTSYRCALEEG
jgi:hypothetical protein